MSSKPSNTGKRRVFIAATMVAGLFLPGTVNVSPAQAATSGDDTARIVALASAAVGASEAPTDTFAITALGSAAGASTSVSRLGEVLLREGQVPLSVSLPVDGDGATTLGVTTNGTAILSGTKGATDFAVQSFESGAVRINAVISGPQAPATQKYNLTLPMKSKIIPLPDQGGYLVVAKEGDLPAPTSSGDTEYVYPTGLPNWVQEALDRESTLEAVEYNGPTYEPDEAETLAASVGLAADEVPLYRIDQPWAVDANGVSLPTTYTVAGTTLTQSVNTQGAAFPIVADPLIIPVIIAITVNAARVAAPAVARAFAAQTIRRTATATTKNGYTSFKRFKSANRTGKERTHDWHHIVEQGNIARRGWDARTIHNKQNMVQIPRKIHQKCINSNMARKNVSLPGHTSGPYNTLRESMQRLSWERQYQIGVLLLIHCGVRL